MVCLPPISKAIWQFWASSQPHNLILQKLIAFNPKLQADRYSWAEKISSVSN